MGTASSELPVIPGHEVVGDPAGALGTLLLSPDATGDGATWRPVAEALGDRWRTVLVPLAPQPAHAGPGAIGALAADLVTVADALGVDRFAHAGLGVGAAVGQELALEHPGRVERLVLVSAAAVLMEETLALLAPDGDEDVHVPAVVRTFDTRGWLELVRAPTLVAVGAGAPGGTYAAEVLAAGIAGSRLVEVAGAGHDVPSERPDELAALLREHLGGGS